MERTGAARDRIDPAGAKRLTAQHPSCREVAAGSGAVTFQRFDRIARATRLEAASAADPRAQPETIEANRTDQQAARHAEQGGRRAGTPASGRRSNGAARDRPGGRQHGMLHVNARRPHDRAEHRVRPAPRSSAPPKTHSGRSFARTEPASERPKDRAEAAARGGRPRRESAASRGCASPTAGHAAWARRHPARRCRAPRLPRLVHSATVLPPASRTAGRPQPEPAPCYGLLTRSRAANADRAAAADSAGRQDGAARSADLAPGCELEARARNPASAKAVRSWEARRPETGSSVATTATPLRNKSRAHVLRPEPVRADNRVSKQASVRPPGVYDLWHGGR